MALLTVLLSACASVETQATPPYPTGAEHAANASAERIVHGDYAHALERADRGLRHHGTDPWLLYDRGVALAGLGRLDEALVALRASEALFTDARDRSLPVYRRALSLEMAGRCDEAARDFSRYALLMRPEEPALADEAMAHVGVCIPPTAQEVAIREEAARLSLNHAASTMRAVERESTEAVSALVAGNYTAALTHATAGLELAPQDPWLLYEEGAALAGQNRVDESLAALRRAERTFDKDDKRGQSLATYRRAIELEQAGRCPEEKGELEHYAVLAGIDRSHEVELTRTHMRFCRLTTSERVF